MESQAADWLSELCGMVPRARLGVLFLSRTRQAGPVEVARWPKGAGLPGAAEALAQRAAREDRALWEVHSPTASAPVGFARIAVPLPGVQGGQAAGCEEVWRGALVIEVRDAKEEECSALIDRSRVSLEWLRRMASDRGASGDLGEVVELMAFALERRSHVEASMALATELASRLGCERVAIAIRRNRRLELVAVSHSAAFDRRSKILRDLNPVMEEACDQDAAVAHPAPPGGDLRVAREHEARARAEEMAVVCTVPLPCDDRIVGAVTFEWSEAGGLDLPAIQRLEDTMALLGPLLERIRRADAPWWERARERLREVASQVFGPGYTAMKATTVALVLAAGVLLVVPGRDRVSADATLEGRVQRAIVASMDGFISQVEVSPGDLVSRGQSLAELDSTDLRLEHRRWQGRRTELQKEHREALASFDRARMAILGARIAQAEAQVDLLEANLSRTRLEAPFDAVVVRGDLRQSMGSPVEKGAVLFELAPLKGYRIILEVDGRDISRVAEGQAGELVLSAMPGETLAFEVERVTPVATASDGHNVFRVEAQLESPATVLRPGMAGIAKIEIGRRSLLWIWSHEIVDRLRMWLWLWRP